MSLGCSGSSKASVAREVHGGEGRGREVLEVDRARWHWTSKVMVRILFWSSGQWHDLI